MTKKVGYLTAFIVVFLIMIFIVSGFAFQNEPEGFRGLKWGDPPTEGMELVKETDGVKRYVRLDEKLYLGDAKLSRILYHFKQDEFIFVSLDFSGNENYGVLNMICRGKFGEGEDFSSSWSEDLSHFEYFWNGIVYLSYDYKEEKGMLLLSEGLFSDRKEQLRIEKIKEQVEKAEGDW